MTAAAECRSAGLLRRLGAMFYDSLVVSAMIIAVTFLFLPFTGGEAITADKFPLLSWVYNGVRLGIFIGFFGWFWTRRGQTLGMAAWRIRIERADGCALSWADAMKRLAAACVSALAFGSGYLWLWVDRNGLTWHDRWTGTQVVVLKKERGTGAQSA